MFEQTGGALHIPEVGPLTPRLPRHRWTVLAQVAVSAGAHIAAASMVMVLMKPVGAPAAKIPPHDVIVQHAIDVARLVFIAREPLQIGNGGGGGGNRQTGAIRHAHGVGSDPFTLRVAKPASATDVVAAVPPLASVLLDARPLAAGTFEQIGLPIGGVEYGTSTGPGSGEGVGTGVGTGIGPGSGPGIGPGSGGGIGGGAYRPGGAVTAPRVIVEVTPTYTNGALVRRIQGTVVLELVVTHDGRPSQIHVIRSLDSELDQQAVSATAQWRFDPGRLAGAPVDVLVTVMLDFWIR